MLSVLIEAGADRDALGASLAALVPGAVDGLVRDVIVIDRGLDAGAREVAEHAGCRVVSAGPLAATIATARGDWLLLLEPGARPSAGWIESVGGYVAAVEVGRRMPRAACFSRVRDGKAGFWRDLRERLSRCPAALSRGLLFPKADALRRAGNAVRLAEIAEGVATTRLEAALRPWPAPRP